MEQQLERHEHLIQSSVSCFLLPCYILLRKWPKWLSSSGVCINHCKIWLEIFIIELVFLSEHTDVLSKGRKHEDIKERSKGKYLQAVFLLWSVKCEGNLTILATQVILSAWKWHVINYLKEMKSYSAHSLSSYIHYSLTRGKLKPLGYSHFWQQLILVLYHHSCFSFSHF